jgi:single-strand DNA-binding protein
MDDAEVRIIGNLGRDPENKFTPSGKLVCEFSVGVTIGYGDNKRTDWYKCTAWEKNAELIGNMCVKGTTILVRGPQKLDLWIAKDGGEPRGQINVTVRDWRILKGGKAKNGGDNPYDEVKPDTRNEQA